MNIMHLYLILFFALFSGCGNRNNNDTVSFSPSGKKVTLSGSHYFNFENYPTGTTPQGWTVAVTGKGPLCSYKITEDNGNKVLKQTSAVKKEYRFNLITNDSLYYVDVALSVRFKGVEGDYDRGGGVVWRYTDENNYYVVRANPLENNFRLYKVVDGNRMQLKSADIPLNSNQWYDIKVEMKGNRIKCYFNGKPELEITDDTFKNPGKVGLWTKSDAVTEFDDFNLKPL